MWRFIAGLSAVRKTEWAEKKIIIVPHVFLKTKLTLFMTSILEVYNWHDGNKNSLRTIEAQIVQNIKNNEARPKFTGSDKRRSLYFIQWYLCTKFLSFFSDFLALGLRVSKP